MGYVLEFRDQPSASVFEMTPETALQFFKAKGLTPTFSYADMVREEHDVAFTVAKMMQLDLLNTTQRAAERAIAEGKSIGAFRRELAPILKSAGWWGTETLRDPVTGQLVEAQLGSAHRLNTIYRSNLQSAYSVGRWERIQENAEDAPWLIYDAVDDSRTREAHARLDNRVLPVSDPFWHRFMPPNGYNCRCGVIQASDRDLERLGLKPSKRPRVKMVDWKNPRTGQTERIPAAVDPGWDHNPGMDRLQDLRKLAREKVRTYPKDWQEPATAALEQQRPYFEGDGREMQWHRAGFDASPEALKQAVRGSNRIEVRQTPGKGAYAMGGRLVEMGNYDTSQPQGRGVWRHEFGHILDVQIGQREQVSRFGYFSSGPSYLSAIKRDAKALQDAAGKGRRSKALDTRRAERQAAYTDARERAIRARGETFEVLARTLAEEADIDYSQFIEAVKRETLIFQVEPNVQEIGAGGRVRLAEALVAIRRGDLEQFVGMLLYRDSDDFKLKRQAYKTAEILGSLSDLGGSTTRNRVAGFSQGFPGHSDSYYRSSPHRAPTEAFANVTSVMGHELPIWQAIVRRFTPAQVEEWERIINKTAGDQDNG